MAAKTSEWRPGPTVCRCCLSEGCYKDISTEYFWMGKREVYSEMLAETFDLSISYSKSGGPNSQSRLICEACIARLRDASDFKRQVQECEKTFVQCLDPATALNEIPVSLDLEKEVKVEMVKEEKGASDDDFDDAPDFADDDDYDDLDDQPLTKLASKIPKKETVDVMELLDGAKVVGKRKSSSKIKSHSSKKAKTKQTASSSRQKPEPEPKPKKKDQVVVKEEPADLHEDTMETLRERLLDDFADELSGSQEDCNGEGRPEKDWSKVAERRGFGPILRENTLKMLEISTMIPFQYNKSWFACIFCKESFMTTYMLREHMLEHTRHDMEKKIISQQNKLIKVEISLLKCKLCGEESSNISSLDEFRQHIKDAHGLKLDNDLLVPYKLETEGMKCQICSETFDNFRLLHMHVNKHFWNHICEICGRSFTTLVFLNLHRTRFHRTYKCNECGLTFTSGAEKKQHDTNTHNVKFERKERYPCHFCGERFFQESLRVQHLVDKHGVEKPEHKCSLCLKTFITKSLLNNHMKTVHKKERKHGCDICHSFFYTKSDVLRHRVTHTREKKFSCTLCKSAFATKDSLRKHLKRNACVA